VNGNEFPCNRETHSRAREAVSGKEAPVASSKPVAADERLFAVFKHNP
jgi:hypothetical protein